MRLTATLGGVGLLLAGVVGSLPAQSSTWRTAPASVARSTPTYYAPYTPPCNTPGTTVVPGVPLAPGTIGAPGAGVAPGGTIPGATPPGVGAIPPGVGAGAGAAAAPSDGDSARGAVGETGSDALASAAPQMIGDLGGTGFAGYRPRSSSNILGTTPTSRGGQKYERALIAARSGVKIAENESPRPLDRAFITYNYFNGINTFGGGQADLHRGIIGFEKTFLEGGGSFGLRLPFLQGDGPGSVAADGFGDLSIIGKYAFYNDPSTGDLLSGGLVVSVPTGISSRLANGSTLSSVLIQPWAGFILGLDDLFVQGFTSFLIPTDRDDITLYTLDTGIGYRLYRGDGDAFINAIIPTFEAHLNVPLSSHGPGALVYFPDAAVFLTGGVHFQCAGNSWLTLGAVVPVSGPQLNDVEFVAQFNLRF